MKTEDILQYEAEARALREALGVYRVAFEFTPVGPPSANEPASGGPSALPEPGEAEPPNDQAERLAPPA